MQSGTLQAVGTFTGIVTDAAGNVTSGSQQISLPVDISQSEGSCQILDLVLGLLDLDLLGLQVHLDQVHLNITAQHSVPPHRRGLVHCLTLLHLGVTTFSERSIGYASRA